MLARAPECLARHSLEPVAVHCARRHPAARDDPEPRLGQAVRPQVQPEIAPRPRCSRRERLLVVLAALQPRAAGQRAGAGNQTLNRARPFARRARSTPRPPRVRLRTRKPCVRLRRVTDGWYVRFIFCRSGC